MNTRPHDPFSPHEVPPVVFRPPAEPSLTERRDAAMKALAIAEHAAAPAKKPAAKRTGRPKSTRKPRPTKAEVDAAVAKLEQS